MSNLVEAIKIWDKEFSSENKFPEDKNFISKEAWVQGYVFGKFSEYIPVSEKAKILVQNKNLESIYRLEFNNGQLHGQKGDLD